MSKPDKIMQNEVERLIKSRIGAISADVSLAFDEIGFLEKCFLGNPNIDPNLIARTLYDLCVRVEAMNADDQRLGTLVFHYVPPRDKVKNPSLSQRYCSLTNDPGRAYETLISILTKLFKEVNERAAYRVTREEAEAIQEGAMAIEKQMEKFADPRKGGAS